MDLASIRSRCVRSYPAVPVKTLIQRMHSSAACVSVRMSRREQGNAMKPPCEVPPGNSIVIPVGQEEVSEIKKHLCRSAESSLARLHFRKCSCVLLTTVDTCDSPAYISLVTSGISCSMCALL